MIEATTNASWSSGEAGAELLFKKGGDITGAIRNEHDRSPGDHTYEDAGLTFYTAPASESPTATRKFRIDAGGNLFGTDTSISSLSDVRLKENISDFTYDLSKFKQLKPKTFNWIHQDWHTPLPSSGKHRGFSAQDIELVDEELVKIIALEEASPEKDLVEDGIAKTSDLGRIDAMYISVIQQLMDKIEVLENKVTALEGS